MASLLTVMWDQPYLFDGTRATEVFGIRYIVPEKSIVDMAEALIETGYIHRGLMAQTIATEEKK